MTVTVNGTTRQVELSSVAALLDRLGLDRTRVAVELNREILPKADYDATMLRDGDSLEIVQFVGGG